MEEEVKKKDLRKKVETYSIFKTPLTSPLPAKFRILHFFHAQPIIQPLPTN
jgi:hypothetical protein